MMGITFSYSSFLCLNLPGFLRRISLLLEELRCAGLSGGIISGSSEFPQFLIIGLDQSGKTTLLYRPPDSVW